MKTIKNKAKNSLSNENQKFDFPKMLNQMQAEIQNLRQMLPTDMHLTPEQRKKMAQVATGRWAFVETALEIGIEEPTLMPLGISLEKMQELKDLFHLIKETQRNLEVLEHAFGDFRVTKIYECFKTASHIYRLSELQGKNNNQNALKIYQQLKALRPKKKKTKEEDKKYLYSSED